MPTSTADTQSQANAAAGIDVNTRDNPATRALAELKKQNDEALTKKLVGALKQHKANVEAYQAEVVKYTTRVTKLQGFLSDLMAALEDGTIKDLSDLSKFAAEKSAGSASIKELVRQAF